MKPEFALSLTHEGIRLLQRSDDGWLRVGGAALGEPALETRLAALRETAERLARTRPIRTKLILPNSEVLYLDIDVGGATGPDYEAEIRAALDGRTPYTLDELAYDYVVSGKTAQLAVVARETLIEAEDFATKHDFNPVCFAAIPPGGCFAGEPMFGTTRGAQALLRGGEALERDTVAIAVVGDATPPAAGSPPPPTPVKSAGGVPKAPALAQESAAAPVPDKDEADKAAEISAAVTGAVAVPPAGKPAPAATPSAPAPQPRARPTRGLLVTASVLGLLVFGGVLGVFMADGPDEDPVERTVETDAQPAPETTELARETAPSPRPVEPPRDPTAQATAPAVMPEMESLLADPRPERTTPFDTVPLPEEVAEGEEAVPAGTPPPIVNQITDAAPDMLAPPQVAAAGPGLLETETVYAVTGVWQRSPEQPRLPPQGAVNDLYIASLDAAIEIDDALALPSYVDGRDALFDTPLPPIGPGQVFDLDERGLVEATPEGALTPDGVLVYAGSDGPRPAPRPFNTAPQTDTDALAAFRPAPRPEDLAEVMERAQLDGRTRSELGALAPRARPASLQEEALAAAVDDTPSALAVARAPSPPPRPSNMDVIVATALAARAPVERAPSGNAGQASTAAIATAPAQTAPAIPTQASVARQATLENAMRLDRVNLIGVYGTSAERRALVRTSSGRYVKLQVGDRFDGGRVAAIGENSMQYTKSGRNITLEMPNG